MTKSRLRPPWSDGFPIDWIVPDWPVPDDVRAVFTTRSGVNRHGVQLGHSTSPFDAFNLGTHVGDAPEHALANQGELADSIAARAVFNNQVHGWAVNALNESTASGAAFDASICAVPKLACTAMVADCCPILFCLSTPELARPIVGAAHAGWRGLLGDPQNAYVGVIEAIFESFEHLVAGFIGLNATNIVASNLQVWVGPCIGPSAFEVGGEVQAAFGLANSADFAAFSRTPQTGKYFANLPALVRVRLHRLGLNPTQIHGNDGSPEWCTVMNSTRYFSHRRDTERLGGSGRMAAVVWIDH